MRFSKGGSLRRRHRKGLTLSPLHLRRPLLVHQHGAAFAVSIAGGWPTLVLELSSPNSGRRLPHPLRCSKGGSLRCRHRKGLTLSPLHLRRPLLVHQHGAAFAVSIAAEATPLPLLRFQHQSTAHRIAVHVFQLFDSLIPGPHHEIIEPPLPDVSALQCFPPQRSLGWCSAPAPFAQHPARSAASVLALRWRAFRDPAR